jgi:hypothetical protein
VSRSTITRAIGEVGPLLAERGCTVEDGLRLHTLANVVAHLGARGQLGSKRIRVEHGISHLENGRALSRHLGRREHLEAMLRAVAGLVSSQERAPRPEPLRRPPRAPPAGTAG